MNIERESTLFYSSGRVPQLDDDVILRLVLDAATEEWAEELLRETDDQYGVADEIERTDEGLILTHRVGGNCDALSTAVSWLRDVEDALRGGNIDVMAFILTARSEQRREAREWNRALRRAR